MAGSDLVTYSEDEIAEWEAHEASLTARIRDLEAALREIGDREWVENCIDPQWPSRRALAALAPRQGDAGIGG